MSIHVDTKDKMSLKNLEYVKWQLPNTVKHVFFAWPYFRELMTFDLYTRLYFRDYSFLVL